MKIKQKIKLHLKLKQGVVLVETFLKRFSHEAMTLRRSTESKLTKNINSGHVSHLEITEVLFVHCNVANSDFQQSSGVLYSFFSNKSFSKLLDFSSKSFIFLKTCNLIFLFIQVWFIDQNFNPLEIEDKIKIPSVIILSVKYKNDALLTSC